MSVSFKVENVPISAVRDRAMFNAFAGGQSFIIDGIGSELEVTSSINSFVVSLGSGEAVICGGSMLSEGIADTLTLNENESGYLVIEVDLSQTGTNICQFKNVASLTQEDINASGLVYDLPLYQYTTDSNGVSDITDVRYMLSSIIDQTFDGTSANAQSGVAVKSQLDLKQNVLTAGSGIDITGGTISNVFPSLDNVDLNTVTNFWGWAKQTCTNKPATYGGLLVATRNTDNPTQYGTQFFIEYGNDGGTYRRRLSLGIWYPWVKLSECIMPDDTFTAQTGNYSTYASGYVYNNSKSIRFFIPLSKEIVATRFSLTNLSISARGVDGLFLDGQAIRTNGSNTAGYSVSIYVANNGFNVLVTRDTAFSVSNQTPITVTVGTMTGKFS